VTLSVRIRLFFGELFGIVKNEKKTVWVLFLVFLNRRTYVSPVWLMVRMGRGVLPHLAVLRSELNS